MVIKHSSIGANAPVPPDEGAEHSYTLASPEVREALKAATNVHSDASRAASALAAVFDALEDDLCCLDAQKHPHAWGLYEAAACCVENLERTLRAADAACGFIDSKVLR